MKQYALTIDSQYCRNWTPVMAIREILQNALDTKMFHSISKINDKYIIKDLGEGLDTKNFLIGSSTKMNDNTVIGQFGEGMSIAVLIFSRLGRFIEIKSKNKKYNFSFEYNKDWDSQLLYISMEDCTCKGTEVIIEASDDEIAKAKELFLAFKRVKILETIKLYGNIQIDILDASDSEEQNIYVMGQKVTSMKSSFRWNIYDKSIINRDRDAISTYKVQSYMASAISKSKNPDILDTFFKNCHKPDNGEYNGYISINPEYQENWLKSFKRIFGNNAVVESDNPAINLAALDRGKRLIKLPYFVAQGTKFLPQANTVVKDEPYEIVHRHQLLKEENETLEKAKKITNKLIEISNNNKPSYVPVLQMFPIRVVKYSVDPESINMSTEGTAHHGNNPWVGISYDVVKSQDLTKLVGIIIHEILHLTTEKSDMTREFETAFTWLMGNITTKIFKYLV